MATLIEWSYGVTLLAMALYGWLGVVTLWHFIRLRRERSQSPADDDSGSDQALPIVTVQLPLYNEQAVVARLIDAVARLDYPRERLQIQLLDDSTDETTALAAAHVVSLQAAGYDIALVHRAQRAGYKAGALQAGLVSARGALIAIFDADFCPPPHFLRATVPWFAADPTLAIVQARWSHLNPDASVLTGAQAIALDKHFAIEQPVRDRAALFPKFNGAAGLIRRSALEAVGGWQADTVCEDLCLSTRAVLRGWGVRYLATVNAPAELPATLAAYRSQQERWAKGSLQCLVKYGRAILSARERPLGARLYAVGALGAYLANAALLLLLLLQLPLVLLDVTLSPLWLLLLPIGLGHPLLYVLGQVTLYADWRRRLRHLPAMLLITIGLSASQGRAIVEVLLGRRHPFVRTPKGQAQFNRYRPPFDPITLIELACGLYAGVTLLAALRDTNYGAAPLPLAALLGFGLVLYLGWRDGHPRPPARPDLPSAAD